MKKKIIISVLAIALIAGIIALVVKNPSTENQAVEKQEKEELSADTSDEKGSNIDYLVLVNKESKLPDDWEEHLELTTITNSVGDEVQVESKAYEAYLKLKEDVENELAKSDGRKIVLELDSAYRSVAAQQKIWDDFMEKYGEEYTKTYVAVPGYSEHHTGLALDLYFTIDGKEIYENEDLVKYPEIWEVIHKKLPDYGFILRYPEGRDADTGYAYEQWHIRYVDSPEIAREITDKGLILEEYLAAK